jgi:hypothetical protein
METIPFTNRQKILRSFTVWSLELLVLFGIAALTLPAASVGAPNTGGTQKTEKQCKDERAKCLKDCDQLIDIDNNIQRCKDHCTDAYIICTPLRSGQPGGKLGGVRPQILPGQNAPIMRRGVEGEASPPSNTEPAGKGK